MNRVAVETARNSMKTRQVVGNRRPRQILLSLAPLQTISRATRRVLDTSNEIPARYLFFSLSMSCVEYRRRAPYGKRRNFTGQFRGRTPVTFITGIVTSTRNPLVCKPRFVLLRRLDRGSCVSLVVVFTKAVRRTPLCVHRTRRSTSRILSSGTNIQIAVELL